MAPLDNDHQILGIALRISELTTQHKGNDIITKAHDEMSDMRKTASTVFDMIRIYEHLRVTDLEEGRGLSQLLRTYTFRAGKFHKGKSHWYHDSLPNQHQDRE